MIAAVATGSDVALERAPLDAQPAIIDEDRAAGAHAAATALGPATAVRRETLHVHLAQVEITVGADGEQAEVVVRRRTSLEDRTGALDRDDRVDHRQRRGADVAVRIREGLGVAVHAWLEQDDVVTGARRAPGVHLRPRGRGTRVEADRRGILVGRQDRLGQGAAGATEGGTLDVDEDRRAGASDRGRHSHRDQGGHDDQARGATTMLAHVTAPSHSLAIPGEAG